MTEPIHKVEHLVDHGVADRAVAAFLDAAVKSRLNLVVCGDANTGKTTMLRCLSNAVPEKERLIIIEDADEIGSDARQPDLVAVAEAATPNHLIVHLKWIDGVRRVASIREVIDADGTAISTNPVFRPGGDGRAVPGPNISYHTLQRVSAEGFDIELLRRKGGWWEQ